jgi:hypothetical protein
MNCLRTVGESQRFGLGPRNHRPAFSGASPESTVGRRYRVSFLPGRTTSPSERSVKPERPSSLLRPRPQRSCARRRRRCGKARAGASMLQARHRFDPREAGQHGYGAEVRRADVLRAQLRALAVWPAMRRNLVSRFFLGVAVLLHGACAPPATAREIGEPLLELARTQPDPLFELLGLSPRGLGAVHFLTSGELIRRIRPTSRGRVATLRRRTSYGAMQRASSWTAVCHAFRMVADGSPGCLGQARPRPFASVHQACGFWPIAFGRLHTAAYLRWCYAAAVSPSFAATESLRSERVGGSAHAPLPTNIGFAMAVGRCGHIDNERGGSAAPAVAVALCAGPKVCGAAWYRAKPYYGQRDRGADHLDLLVVG